MSHIGPLFVLGQTGTNRANTFSLSQESNPWTEIYDKIAHKFVMTFTSSSMCEAMLSNNRKGTTEPQTYYWMSIIVGV